MRWWDGRAWTGHIQAPVPAPAPAGGFFERLAAAARVDTTREHDIATRHRGTQPLPPQETSAAKAARGTVLAAVIIGLFALVVGGGMAATLNDPTGPGEEFVDPSIRWAMLVGAVVLAGVSIWAWRRYWLIADTPTVEVSGAHPGLCELVGHARAIGEPATAWFAGGPCVWFESKVDRQTGSGKNRRWRTEWQHKGGERRFALVGDEGGSIVVDAAGARFDGDRSLVSQRLGGNHRITEKGLVHGDRVYVLGP